MISMPGWERIADEHVGPYRVSTVRLGHPFEEALSDGKPLFETMVFHEDGAAYDQATRRYPTEDEARAGHDEIVTILRAEQGED